MGRYSENLCKEWFDNSLKDKTIEEKLVWLYIIRDKNDWDRYNAYVDYHLKEHEGTDYPNCKSFKTAVNWWLRLMIGKYERELEIQKLRN